MGLMLDKFREAIANNDKLTAHRSEDYDFKLALDELLAVNRDNIQGIHEQLIKQSTFWDGLGLKIDELPQDEEYQAILDLAAQKSASINREQFNTLVKNNSLFESKNHNELIKLVTELPLMKQENLLKNPILFKNLLHTESTETITRIVGEESDPVGVRALVEENQRLGLFKKIDNAALAQCLINLDPPPALTNNKVQEINKVLLRDITNPNHYDLYLDSGYQRAMGKISDILELPKVPLPQTQDPLPVTYGEITPYSDIFKEPSVKTAIKKQNNYNVHLVEFYKKNTVDHNFLGSFLALQKKAVFPEDQCEVCLKGFLSTNTREKFLELVEKTTYTDEADPANTKQLKDIFDPPLEKQISEEDYKQLRHQALLSRHSGKTILENNSKLIKNISENFASIQSIDTPVRDQLMRMRDINAVEWLNPGFIADAKKNAQELSGLKDLAKVCDSVISKFEQLRQTCETQLSYLPTHEQMQGYPESRINAIKNQRRDLVNQIDQIKKGIDHYKPLQDLLNGKPDPLNTKNRLVTQGLLKTIEQIGERNNTIELIGFTSTYKDYPNSEKEKHLEKAFSGHELPVQIENMTAAAYNEGVASSYRSAAPLKEGHFREYTIKTAQDSGNPPAQIAQGAFIEERAPLSKGAFSKAVPPIKLTVTKFPGTGPEGMAYCMAVASQMLVSGIPTKERPYRLKGSNPEELRYLYAALTILLKADGNYDKQAIKVISTNFDPREDKGLDKLQNEFKKVTGVKEYLDAWKEINKNKKMNSEQQKDLKAITNRYKDHMQQFTKVESNLSKIIEDNKSNRSRGF